jgi:hypothetical protein
MITLFMPFRKAHLYYSLHDDTRGFCFGIWAHFLRRKKTGLSALGAGD